MNISRAIKLFLIQTNEKNGMNYAMLENRYLL